MAFLNNSLLGLNQGSRRKLSKSSPAGCNVGIEQGRQQEAASLVVRLLNRRLGMVSLQLQEQIQSLSTVELEHLGEALLDFTNTADLETWLGNR